MIEVTGDLFDYPADAHCITTNGEVNRRGAAVMGRGCALQAKSLFPGIDEVLGHLIKRKGNRVHYIGHWAPFSPASSAPGWTVVSFPVKHRWSYPASLDLIAMSCVQLLELTIQRGWQDVVIPRPGCGNGQRDWETEVKPILQDLLDERFHIITNT